MDTFLNKLSQKANAQELINANSAADTAKMEMMQKQMDEYDKLLQEMRKVNLKTIENMEQLQKVMNESLQKIEAIQESSDIHEDMGKLLEEMKKQSNELVSAKKQQEDLVAETKKQQEESAVETKRQQEEFATETKKQMEELIAGIKEQQENLLPEMKKQMEDVVQRSDDFLHKENVKVYRNVQAAMTEELDKQSEKILSRQSEMAKSQKAMIPLSIVIILLILADIAVNLLNITLPF
ncbi:MAG: hypothetical protein K2K21_14305 [Lachnospiraceae bacterium]|nr:hypothetical protein [Lachnospiraceae bacterium]